ncbi:MAG: hypothetical protein ACK41E_10655, partial [Deinococcales bacterium]
RAFLREVALQARAKKRGVWAQDVSNQFKLRSQKDIDVNGQLILPKLFRRASSYFEAGFRGNIKEWLVWTQQKQSQNDWVQLNGTKKRLSDLLEVRGSTVRFLGDILDVVFVD